MQLIAKLSIIMSCSNPSNNSQLYRAMFLSGNPLSFFHEQSTKSLVLKLGWVSWVNWHHWAIDVKLSYHWHLSFKLAHESFAAKSSQSQQANQLVRKRILIWNKGLPFIVGIVVSSYQLSVFWTCHLMDLLNANLSGPYISAYQVHLLHFCKSKLSYISVLHSRAYQRHGDVSLYSVDSYPWRNKGQCLGNDFHKQIWSIVLVLSFAPHVIQLGASYDQSWIDFETVSSEVRIREKLLETKQVSFHICVG